MPKMTLSVDGVVMNFEKYRESTMLVVSFGL